MTQLKDLLRNGRGKAAISSFFTRIRKAFTSSLSLTRRKPAQSLPSNIFHHCSNTPLSAFISCIVDHDLKKLIIYGKATDQQLKKAWEAIYSEYAEISGGQSYKVLLSLSKEIGYLEGKLLCIGLCLKVLTRRADDKCIKILKDYGYNYSFDPSNPEVYAKSIDSVATRSGAIKLAIMQKRQELEKKQERIGGKEITRQTFQQILAVLSKHMGFRVDPDEVTVSEFVSYRLNYEKEIEAMQRATEKESYKPIPGVKSNIRG